MPKREPLAPMTVPDSNGAVRSPKTDEIVADTLRRMIVEGQLKTFYNEAGVLTFQPFAKEQSKTVSQVLAEQGLKAAKFLRWAIGRRQ